jgi:hypothetical protein
MNEMKKIIAIFLIVGLMPLSAYALNDHNNSQGQNQGQNQGQDQLQAQLQGQRQGQMQGQLALAVQGQAQKVQNQGNQGQAENNVNFEDRLQLPTHVALAAAEGTDTAQMSIGGLTLSDTAPHVIAQTKMTIIVQALESKLIDEETAKAQVLKMLDELNVQTKPKRLVGWGPRTSGKHLFNLFGIIATDSYRKE